LEHEALSSQRSTFELLNTLAAEETKVTDKIRSGLVIDREVEKHSSWVATMNDQVAIFKTFSFWKVH
jgi:hypothetical protein